MSGFFLLSEIFLISLFLIYGTRWPSGTVPDLRSRGGGFESHQRLLCTNANSACIPPGSVNEYERNWGVNGHTTRCNGPVSVVLRLRLMSDWGLQETEISAAPWALEAWERILYFYCLILYRANLSCCHCPAGNCLSVHLGLVVLFSCLHVNCV